MTVIPFAPRGGSNQPESNHQPDQPNRDEIAKTILSLAVQGGNVDALVRAFWGQWPRVSDRQIHSGAALAHKLIEILHREILDASGGHDGGVAA